MPPAHPPEVRLKRGGDPLKAGDQVNVSIFADGERVDVIGTSRGKGLGRGGRHFHRGRAAGSMFHRAPGSIGASSYPSRVVKGMRMAGRMGAGQVTVRNLKVLRVDADKNLLMVEGAVPGGPNSVVLIRKAIAAKPVRWHRWSRPRRRAKVTVDVVERPERENRIGRAARRRVRWPDQDRPHPRVRGPRQRGRASRHARDEDPSDGQRQRQEAVAPEGNRSRPRRRDSQSAVAQGRHRVRSSAAQLRVPPAAEGREGALRAALAQKLRDGNVVVVDALSVGEIKTKAAEMLKRLGVGGKALLVDTQPEDKLTLSVRNIEGVRVLPSNRVSARDVMDTRRVVLTSGAREAARGTRLTPNRRVYEAD